MDKKTIIVMLALIGLFSAVFGALNVQAEEKKFHWSKIKSFQVHSSTGFRKVSIVFETPVLKERSGCRATTNLGTADITRTETILVMDMAKDQRVTKFLIEGCNELNEAIVSRVLYVWEKGEQDE